MKTFSTKYGELKEMISEEYYDNGFLKECMLNEKTELNTEYGVLIPQFEDDEARRKHKKAISFYSSGNIKSIALQNQITINTLIGLMPAEYITFYEDGSLKRVFPLDGKLSGFWSEDNEYALAKAIDFSFSFGKFSKKVIGIFFYPKGEVKSITFWPKEKVIIETPKGLMVIKNGISFFADGKIKSVEPARTVPVGTLIGTINAYDVNPLGIHGDDNSLKFNEKGEIIELTTSTDIITVVDNLGKSNTFAPDFEASIIDDEETDVIPINIQFSEGKVIFNKDKEFSINYCIFTIEARELEKENLCSSCEGCSGCS